MPPTRAKNPPPTPSWKTVSWFLTRRADRAPEFLCVLRVLCGVQFYLLPKIALLRFVPLSHDGNDVIYAFPVLDFGPVEREENLAPQRQVLGR